jgi:hypothetical protein
MGVCMEEMVFLGCVYLFETHGVRGDMNCLGEVELCVCGALLHAVNVRLE